MSELELFGTAGCPYTSEMREWLEWNRREFAEYDVEMDEEARVRLGSMMAPPYTVPVLVEAGRVVQVGWHGRGCVAGVKSRG
jgi:glutaredoxin